MVVNCEASIECQPGEYYERLPPSHKDGHVTKKLPPDKSGLVLVA